MTHHGGPERIAPVTVVATWPEGSFAESVAVDPAGMIFVSLHTDRVVVRVDPVTGTVQPFAATDRPVTGLAFLADGTLIASGGAPGEAPGSIWQIAPDGHVRPLARIDGASFLNGLTPLGDGVLVADSLNATIYRVTRAGEVTPWLIDALLAPPPGLKRPGANGIKRFGGRVAITVTATERVVTAPIEDMQAGRPSVLAEHLHGDDFAFSDDGAMFIATHPSNSLVRLRSDGSRTTLAGLAEGLRGATAVAFGRREADRESVYVTTTGGTWMAPPHELEPARLLKVDVGVRGHPLLPAENAMAVGS